MTINFTYQVLSEKAGKTTMSVGRFKTLNTELIKTLYNLDPIFMKNLSKPTRYQSPPLSAGEGGNFQFQILKRAE